MKEIQYKPKERRTINAPVFSGELSHLMPDLFDRRLIVLSPKEYMEQRVNAAQSKDEMLKAAWCDRHYVTSSSILYSRKGIKIVPHCRFLANMNSSISDKPDGSYNFRGFSEFRDTEGYFFSHDEVGLYTNCLHSSIESVVNNPIWNAIAEEDQDLLREYAKLFFSTSSQSPGLRIGIVEDNPTQTRRILSINKLTEPTSISDYDVDTTSSSSKNLVGIPKSRKGLERRLQYVGNRKLTLSRVFRGSILESMSELLEQGYRPATSKEILLQRVIAWESGNEELAREWEERYLIPSDSLMRHPNGSVIIVPNSQNLRNVTPESSVNFDGELILDNGTFDKTPGYKFSPKDIEEYCDVPLTPQEAIENPFLLALCGEDRNLLKAYVDNASRRSNNPMSVDILNSPTDTEVEGIISIKGKSRAKFVRRDFNIETDVFDYQLKSDDAQLLGVPKSFPQE